MNILIDKLPESVEIAGAFHSINCSYKAGILFEQIMHDKALSDIEKITESLLLFYGRVDGPMAEKAEKIIWFYSCGKGTEEATTCSAADEKPLKRIYSFEYDAEYIYAAFWSQYGIDLQKEDLHWWQFLALFRALSEENEICRIMEIRAVELDSKMSKEERERYIKLKRLYALPDERSEQEKVNDFSRAFFAGMQR